jgi:hypothetical protein
MRLLLLACCLALAACCLALAACSSPDPPPEERPGTAAPPLRVETDSLTARDTTLHYDVAIAYPRIAGSDAPAVARVNRAIRDTLTAFTASLKPRPADFTGDPDHDRLIVGEAEGGPARTFLGDRVFSSRVDVYAFTGGAHGNTYAFPFTYDLATGEPIRFGDLFRGGTAYLDTLAALTTERLAAELDSSQWFVDAVPAEPGSFAFFTLGADSLTVFFPPYAIAPYAAGASEVSLPYTALRPLLSPSGPLQHLADEG